MSSTDWIHEAQYSDQIKKGNLPCLFQFVSIVGTGVKKPCPKFMSVDSVKKKSKAFANKHEEDEDQDPTILWQKAAKATNDKSKAFKELIEGKRLIALKLLKAHQNAPAVVLNTKENILKEREEHIFFMATTLLKHQPCPAMCGSQLLVFTTPNAEGMEDFQEFGCNALVCKLCKMHICRLCRQWTKCRGCLLTLSADMADVEKGIFQKEVCDPCSIDAHRHWEVCPHKQNMVDNGDADFNDPQYYASQVNTKTQTINQEEQDRIFLLNAQDRIRSDLHSLPLWSEKELYWESLDSNPTNYKQGDMASYFGTPIPGNGYA
ncbi:hypothetical protein T484DRAFT_2027765 [Baffinella frigidus]|nr:hypothetical protein T484DRAFT_2027765 [Cryptophyta sp. CCMP2293]